MRKPIEQELREPWTDKLPAVGGAGRAVGKHLMTPRERMWQAMKQLNRKGDWTISQVTDLAHPVELSSVKTYVDSLVTAGLVERKAEQQGQGAKKVGLAKGTGNSFEAIPHRMLVSWHEAPRLTREGRVVTQGLGNLAMWRCARIRKVFTPSQLATEASVGEIQVKLSTAKQYCLALEKSGYFKLLKKGHGGGVESQYQLIRDTGPIAPAITRAKVVFDRNIGELQPLQTAQELCDELG
jgi:hypothetical protein